MKKFKAKLKRPFAEALKCKIDEVIRDHVGSDDDDDEKLLMATLAEISSRLYKKLESVQKEYAINFTQPQAFALRILYKDWFDFFSPDYTTSHLRIIADAVHQQYQ